jgi:predicted O-methyltransferase YrrM
MKYADPHRQLETPAEEMSAVDGALAALREAGVLDDVSYDHEKFDAHRTAVRENFDIPWTAITPRMQRLLYAINAVSKPEVMVAVGVFCGNTYISNAGAGVGPGAVYTPRRSVDIDIRTEEADRARRNVEAIDPDGAGEILGCDGIEWLREFDDTVDLLYVDADGRDGQGKKIYLEILQTALPKMPTGSLVIAHNSVNAARELTEYFEFVRDESNFCASVNVFIDGEGIEVSSK